MINSEQLEKLSRMDLAAVNRAELVDIREVYIDDNLTYEEKIMSYLEQIKNPYCFLVGDMAVHIQFDPEGGDLQSKLKHYFSGYQSR